MQISFTVLPAIHMVYNMIYKGLREVVIFHSSLEQQRHFAKIRLELLVEHSWKLSNKSNKMLRRINYSQFDQWTLSAILAGR